MNEENRLGELVRDILDSEKPLCEASHVLSALDEAPYFTSVALAWLKRKHEEGAGVGDAACREIVRRVIAAMPAQSHEALYQIADLAGESADEWASFYPEEKAPETPSTTDTIDRFLSTYTQSDKDEESLIERLIFNPVPDYASVLAEQEIADVPEIDSAPEGSPESLINSFILKSREREATGATVDVASTPLVVPAPIADGRPVTSPPPPRDDSTLRESLAKFYIKRKRYEKAYEIIEQLNLNYPEKNIYFAPQLRFLAKLIANERARQKREGKS